MEGGTERETHSQLGWLAQPCKEGQDLNEGRDGASGGGTGQHEETVMGLAAD